MLTSSGSGNGSAKKKQKPFFTFASSTTLHGWSYLSVRPTIWCDTIYWVIVLGIVHAIGLAFIISNTSEFLSTSIHTSIESTTTPLSEVFFPAVTMCNINQVEASLLVQMGIYGKLSQMNPVYKQFVEGGSLNEQEVKELNANEWFKTHNYRNGSSFSDEAHQPCPEMILEVDFQGNKLNWQNMDKNIGPITVGTDYGNCCFFAPQIGLDYRSFGSSFGQLLHNKVRKGAYNGEVNGLSMLIDVETFNFAYHATGTWGVKLAVHDHRIKPLIQHQSILIQPGVQSNIVVAPSLYYTSENAISRLKPSDRQCFEDREVNLTYLSWDLGFHYDLSNCLLNLAINKAFEVCNCTPFFATSLKKTNNLPFCTNVGISCVNNITSNIGEEGENYVIDDLRGYKRKDKIQCLSRCASQNNDVQLTSTKFPQSTGFIRSQMFCILSQKLLKKPCVSSKRRLLEESYPNICQLVEERKSLFHRCQDWPESFFERPDYHEGTPTFEKDQIFLNALLNYSSTNLARIIIMIKDPYVQLIKRDVSITFTNYIANMGGLLGLCLGFSFVSMAEVLYHFVLKIAFRQISHPRSKGNKIDIGN